MVGRLNVLVLDQEHGENFAMYHGDSCELLKGIPDNSIHYIIYSPPFESLYTFSNSERDLGNANNGRQFAKHFRFIIRELYRVLMPGRLMSVHCMDLPRSKQRDGVIGLRDFPGTLTRMYERAGFVKHSEVCIWKDPVIAMQRTKAIGLLHKQICKDSCMSRQGISDKLLTFRKDGDNPEKVSGLFQYYSGEEKWKLPADKTKASIEVWQRYASPVWMDINPSDTLQRESARENEDERHIHPLQLQVIERGLQLWTNPGDIVLSPFGGIGSEGFQSIKMGRKFIGCELKESYYRQAVKNLQRAEFKVKQTQEGLF